MTTTARTSALAMMHAVDNGSFLELEVCYLSLLEVQSESWEIIWTHH